MSFKTAIAVGKVAANSGMGVKNDGGVSSNAGKGNAQLMHQNKQQKMQK